MRISKTLAVVSLATLCLLGPLPAGAGKPSGGGGGSGIKVAELVKPAGSVEVTAAAINDSGTIAVGAAYWNATWDYTNEFYAVRWTRASTSDPWVVEDLKPTLSTAMDSRATGVNDAGTIVFMSFRKARNYVLTSTGSVIDLGTVSVTGLSNNDTMVGYRSGPQSIPMYWASPSDTPQDLPTLAGGYGAVASMFQGADVIGAADDASGRWLVRWVNTGGSWSVHRIVLLPTGAGLTGMNSAGRLALNLRDSTNANFEWPLRAAVWDPPYTQPPVILPTVSGTASSAGAVLEDGTVTGVVTASSKTVKNWLPVIWPTPSSVVQLPLLSGAKYGVTGGVNAYRQMVGAVSFVDRWTTNEHAVLWTLP